MNATKNIRRFQLCVVLSIAMSYGLPGIAQGDETCPTNSSGPDICVSFDGSAPVEEVHFRVDYTTDAANPSVELLTGNLTWNVRSDDSGSPGNIGTITLDPTVNTADFTVKIADGSGPGAVDVASMVLDGAANPNWEGFSSIAGLTQISGNVNGAITLVETTGGAGGEVTGVVGIVGSVTGPICIPKVTGGIVIGGNVINRIDVEEISGSFRVEGSDHITVGTLSGTLIVLGTVPFGKTVTIQTLTVTGDVALGTLGGTLELINGLPSECSGGSCPPDPSWANVGVGVLSSTGVIDLKGADVAGTLSVTQGQNNSQIIAGGAVSGFIYPGFTTSGYFNGTVTVSSVSAIGTLPTLPTGEIEAFSGAALNGIVNVSGSVAGVVEASGPFTGQINVGSVAAAGVIEAFQGALGTIVVNGALLGTVEVIGDLSGTIRAKGTLDTTGRIEVSGALTGSGKILVSGMCDGEVQIGQQTDASTLIHLLGGLESTGKVKVNTTKGNFNADGDIHVGPIFYIALPPPALPPPITFDGCIRILKEDGGNGGDLTGKIKVVGCHADETYLNICIDGGDGEENITIQDTGCPNQPEHSCGTCT